MFIFADGTPTSYLSELIASHITEGFGLVRGSDFAVRHRASAGEKFGGQDPPSRFLAGRTFNQPPITRPLY
jgi:hypothetical protein